MNEIAFLVLFPIVVALFIQCIKGDKERNLVIVISIVGLVILSIIFAIRYYNNPYVLNFINSEYINKIIIIIESFMTFYIIYKAIKFKKLVATVLSSIQFSMILIIEFFGKNTDFTFKNHLLIDKLSIIMVLIISIIGGSIAIYAISYMSEYQKIHKDIKDKRKKFFSIIFIFFSGMFGIVLCNDLIWINFFWEVTTLCSFLLIGYTDTDEAKNNAFLSLYMNLIGGLSFVVGISILRFSYDIRGLDQLINIEDINGKIILSVMLISIAGLSKGAQFPFSKWLLGAMVAPTPSSALLHSSTMVKAGVYLLIRLSPVTFNNIAGDLIALIGGITFLLMSFIAISQNDGKKILAYSTMANLGLIVACAGIGTYESIWAGILLVIFHSVSKSLMFLSVGATENIIGSRDIEDMHGLIIKLPEMALMMAIGIAGMFLAPFGMLISKWAALKAFVDSRNVIIVLMLVYGSAATLFYWTKWLGKLAAIRNKADRVKSTVKKGEWMVLVVQAVITISLCILYPLVSNKFIVPFIHEMFNISQVNMISQGNQYILTIMLSLIVIIPFGMRFLTSRGENIVSVYMAGINDGDDKHFSGAYGEKKSMYLSSWYMEGIFGEKKLLSIGIYLSLILLIGLFSFAIGGIL